MAGHREKTDLVAALEILQHALAASDFGKAVKACKSKQSEIFDPLIVAKLQRIKLRIDASKNHKRPHVHIDYGVHFHAASYAIDTGERLAGQSKYDREVSAWIEQNRGKLLEAWALMQAGKDAAPVAYELRGTHL